MKEHAASEAAARRLHGEWIAAWNGRDAARLASLVGPDGIIIGFDGSEMRGPNEVAVAIVRGVRPLGTDAALLHAAAGMPGASGEAINPVVNAVQSLVAERIDGEWRIALFQNTPAAFHDRPEAAAALTAELTEALASR